MGCQPGLRSIECLIFDLSRCRAVHCIGQLRSELFQIQKGCANSISSIVDGNVTVVIVAIILMLVFGPKNILSSIFGPSTTGAVYSFGYTLLVGIIGNFLMGVLASRLIISIVSRLP